MFVKQIDDFLFQKFPLKHILDGQLIRTFDFCNYLFKFGRLKNSIRLDDGDSKREVDLFWIEKSLFHSEVIF